MRWTIAFMLFVTWELGVALPPKVAVNLLRQWRPEVTWRYTVSDRQKGGMEQL